MKIRIRGMICGGFGLISLLAGILFAVHALAERPPLDAGKPLVVLVRYYDLRGEILLGILGLTLLLAATALLLSPYRRWVAISPPQGAEVPADASTADIVADIADTAVQAGDGSPAEKQEGKLSSEPATEPHPVCHLRTRLMGSTFCNTDGASRQHALGQIQAGDILVCRSPEDERTAETVGVFTVGGCQLGFLDAAFLRFLRGRYPGCRIGVEVERVCGGGKLPYICDLKVAVYRV